MILNVLLRFYLEIAIFSNYLKTDINECKIDSLNKCGSNSICVNTPGGHRCECMKGFKMINGECHSKCDDCCRRNEKLFLHGEAVPADDKCSKCKCEVSDIGI